MGEDLKTIAAEIEALPVPEQLRLAASLLENRRTEIAHTIISRISTELGAALLLAKKPAEERRANVQGDYHRGGRKPGTITWSEHLEAFEGYAKRYGRDQSAQRLHERGGFGYEELVLFLGHEPKTWRPR